jgi:hypothetical protein
MAKYNNEERKRVEKKEIFSLSCCRVAMSRVDESVIHSFSTLKNQRDVFIHTHI